MNMSKTLKVLEQDLFLELRTERNYQYFISDGLFDEDEWDKQKIKLLFVLKEANWENANEDFVNKADKSYWLRKIAAMNLKKVGGDEVAEDETIRQYAKDDAQYLNRQIKLYNPDMIICCGRGNGKNADILHDIVFSKEEVSEWMTPVHSYNYFLYQPNDEKQVPVFSFYHPQMRGNHELFQKKYNEMLEIGEFFRSAYLNHC